MDDDYSSSDPAPEVTISPADNGHVVRWHQRSGKKGEPGRSITRVAASADDALEHARSALGSTGKSKSPKRKPLRNGQLGTAGAGDGDTAPAAHFSSKSMRGSARRRRPRVGGRR
jgi:hypothetical protein